MLTADETRISRRVETYEHKHHDAYQVAGPQNLKKG